MERRQEAPSLPDPGLCPSQASFGRGHSSETVFRVGGRSVGSSSSEARLVTAYTRTGRSRVFYSRKVGYFLQVLDFEPRVVDRDGNRRPPSEELRLPTDRQGEVALCYLNAILFYWFVTVFSDCRHVNKREVDAFPVNLEKLASSSSGDKLVVLAKELMANLKKHSIDRTMRIRHDTLTVQHIFPKLSKSIIDRIDEALGSYYGFSAEEIDFIINYDIKYRLGADSEEEEELPALSNGPRPRQGEVSREVG